MSIFPTWVEPVNVIFRTWENSIAEHYSRLPRDALLIYQLVMHSFRHTSKSIQHFKLDTKGLEQAVTSARLIEA
jgi:hypothetical protein